MEPVISFLSTHYPTIGICIAVALIVYWATMYHVSLQNMRRKVEELPCDAHNQAFINIEKAFTEKIASIPCDTHRKKLNEQDIALNKQGESINDISVWVMKRDKSMIPLFMSKKSPYYLNPTGLALLEDCGGKKCIDENVDYFISKLESTNPDTPYDVEERAMKIVMSSKGLPFFNPIKHYLYFKPDVVELGGNTVEISIFAVASVMGIYLRDIYLEKHPEIMPEHSSVYA